MVNFPWTVRCLSMVVLASNGTSLVLMRPRLKKGVSKPFTFNVSIFLDSPYVLFVLGMPFSVPLIESDHLTLDDFVLTILPNIAMTFYLPRSIYLTFTFQIMSEVKLGITN